MNTSTTALPNVASARLPKTYETAKNALSECSRIDECMDWANKAEAMASYAKQAEDDTLHKLAVRIQSRAVRRCGELLKQVMPSKGGRPSNEKTRTDTDTSFTRTQVATAAGLSKRQKDTALRVATIPQADFDGAVESESPPTVTKLAERGKVTKLIDIGDIPPADYARATEAQGTLRRFAEFCKQHDPKKIARAFQPHEIKNLRNFVSTVDVWLDQFVANLKD
jgi:hypothetical protein